MTREAVLKTSGYVVSTVSVACLGVVSWEGAKDRPLLFALLIAGMATSVGGMLLRWLALLAKQRDEKARVDPQSIQPSMNVEVIPATVVIDLQPLSAPPPEGGDPSEGEGARAYER